MAGWDLIMIMMMVMMMRMTSMMVRRMMVMMMMIMKYTGAAHGLRSDRTTPATRSVSFLMPSKKYENDSKMIFHESTKKQIMLIEIEKWNCKCDDHIDER